MIVRCDSYDRPAELGQYRPVREPKIAFCLLYKILKIFLFLENTFYVSYWDYSPEIGAREYQLTTVDVFASGSRRDRERSSSRTSRKWTHIHILPMYIYI